MRKYQWHTAFAWGLDRFSRHFKEIYRHPIRLSITWLTVHQTHHQENESQNQISGHIKLKEKRKKICTPLLIQQLKRKSVAT